jgi:CHASE3 domain
MVWRRHAGASQEGDRPTDESATSGGLTLRMVVASMLLALVVGGAFAVVLFAISDARDAQRRSDHSQNVLIASNGLERLLLDFETGIRGFVLTRQARFREPWSAASRHVPSTGARAAGTRRRQPGGGGVGAENHPRQPLLHHRVLSSARRCREAGQSIGAERRRHPGGEGPHRRAADRLRPPDRCGTPH